MAAVAAVVPKVAEAECGAVPTVVAVAVKVERRARVDAARGRGRGLPLRVGLRAVVRRQRGRGGRADGRDILGGLAEAT